MNDTNIFNYVIPEVPSVSLLDERDIIEEKVKKRNISAKTLMFVDTRKNYLTERR